MLRELLVGALVSFVNFGIHGVMTALIVFATHHTKTRTNHLGVFVRLAALLTVTMVVLMGAHIVEIGVWASYYLWAGIRIQNAGVFDFAFENYTALGYGDAVAIEGRRLVGPITALNGLLLIGWSVAIIFEVMRMAELQIGRDERDEN
jgi:Ion channel